ncbi:hypothetical protein DFH28DRAFT_1094396 [Melampsora americana]|nr:hypothetical protein DFH28DRAFT_1094396 [Melampsora americana]
MKMIKIIQKSERPQSNGLAMIMVKENLPCTYYSTGSWKTTFIDSNSRVCIREMLLKKFNNTSLTMALTGEMHMLFKQSLEIQWQRANKICNGTGGGVCDAALELKDNMNGPMIALIGRYFLTQHGNTRLSVAHNLSHKTKDDNDSNPENKRNPLENSPNSNLAYQDLQDDAQRDALQHSLYSNLAHLDDYQHNSDELMQTLGEMFDEDEHIQQNSPSVDLTQTQYQGPTTSSTPLKQTASNNTLQSTTQSTHGKRLKKGSASKVQDLVQCRNISRDSRGSASVEPSNQIVQAKIISKQEAKIDQICTMADNIANMFLQKPKFVLDKSQAKQKAKIELKTAKVMLSSEKKKLNMYDFDLNVKRDHHELEMQAKRAELERQQTARHAQLISMLMKDNNLTLEEATSAAKAAAGLVTTTRS